jgi:hypothetical protein
MLEDIILPDKPIMLRWRQSEPSPPSSQPSQISPLKSSLATFTVTLPKTASPSQKTPVGAGAKFVNFTASNPHQKKTASYKSKEQRKNAKGHAKEASRKAQGRELQRREKHTPLDIAGKGKDKTLKNIPHYPSPLDRYFFSTTPFPITNLASLNTGHYTNYCTPLPPPLLRIN